MSTEYAVALEGHPFDLEDLREIFSIGPIRVTEIEVAGDRRVTALMADEFGGLASDTQVLETARRLVAQFNGALFAANPDRSLVRQGAIYTRVAGAGWGAGTIYATLNATLDPLRMRARVTVCQPSGTPLPPSSRLRPRPSRWLELAAANTANGDRVANVLHALSSDPDWFDLWKAEEVIHGDQHAIPNWPSDDIEWFRATATRYRHSPSHMQGTKAQNWLQNARKPEMDLATARRLVGRVAAEWLDWIANRQSS